MKSKILCIFLLIIISFPSICFSESVTVIGEDCYIHTKEIDGEMKQMKMKPMSKKTQREILRHSSIFNMTQ